MIITSSIEVPPWGPRVVCETCLTFALIWFIHTINKRVVQHKITRWSQSILTEALSAFFVQTDGALWIRSKMPDALNHDVFDVTCSDSSETVLFGCCVREGHIRLT